MTDREPRKKFVRRGGQGVGIPERPPSLEVVEAPCHIGGYSYANLDRNMCSGDIFRRSLFRQAALDSSEPTRPFRRIWRSLLDISPPECVLGVCRDGNWISKLKSNLRNG